MYMSKESYGTYRRTDYYECGYSFQEPYFEPFKNKSGDGYYGYRLRFVSDDKNGTPKRYYNIEVICNEENTRGEKMLRGVETTIFFGPYGCPQPNPN